MSGDAEGEVRVKLVFDSNAKAATDDSKKEIEKLDKSAKKGFKGVMDKTVKGTKEGFSVIKGAFANVLGHAFEKMGELAKEAIIAPFEAFTESEEQVRGLTATLGMLVNQGTSLDTVHTAASGIKDELEAMAMQAGVTDDAMVAVFTNLIEHGDKSIAQAQELAEQMAYAGRAIPGGAEALSGAFEQIQMGIIKAKNPLVQMISATGMLKGNAKAVAKEMASMSVEKQMELAEKAVAKMATKMKEQPMTIQQMVTSMKVLAGNLMETAGQPMVESATKVVEKIRNAFFDSKGNPTQFAEDLTKYAKIFGDSIGKVISLGMEFIDGFGVGISEFSTVFSAVWKEVFGTGDASFQMWKDFAKEIGQVIGAELKAMATVVGAIVIGIQQTMKYVTVGAGKIMQGLGDITGDKKTTAAGNSMVARGYAGEQSELVNKAKLTQGGSKDEIKSNFLANAKSAGRDMDDANREIDAAFAERKRRQGDVDEAAKQIQTGNLSAFADAFNDAAKVQDEGAMNQIAATMRGSSAIKDALMNKGPEMLGQGAQAFIEALKRVDLGDMAGQLKGMQKSAGAGIDVKPAPVTQNFHGGIQIKQDFKDADPDRILVAFQERLGSIASSRSQARSAVPFAR